VVRKSHGLARAHDYWGACRKQKKNRQGLQHWYIFSVADRVRDSASVYGTEGCWFEPSGVYCFRPRPRESRAGARGLANRRDRAMKKGRNLGGRPRTLALSDLGQRIESAAKRRGMTRGKVAAAAGLSTVTLHMICTGKIRDPKASTLVAIATALGIPVTRLLAPSPASRSA
jgi:DNA-binding Xre family transcriptional regulator